MGYAKFTFKNILKYRSKKSLNYWKHRGLNLYFLKMFSGNLILPRSFAAVHLITISVSKKCSFPEENLLIESNGFENEAVKDENGDLKYEPGDYLENGREEEEEKEGSERIFSEEGLEENSGRKLRGPLPLIRYC
jgi:hypothetical protein